MKAVNKQKVEWNKVYTNNEIVAYSKVVNTTPLVMIKEKYSDTKDKAIILSLMELKGILRKVE